MGPFILVLTWYCRLGKLWITKVGPDNCDEDIHRAMRAEGPQDFLTSWRSYLSRLLKWQLNFIIRGKRGGQIMPLATARWLWRQGGDTSWNRLMCPVAHIHTCHGEIQSQPWVWLPIPAACLVSSQSELTTETAGAKPFFSSEMEIPYSRAGEHLGALCPPLCPCVGAGQPPLQFLLLLLYKCNQ